MFKSSTIKFISMGIVAADKPETSKFIEVYPVELLPNVVGEITSAAKSVPRTGTDASGSVYNVTLDVGMSVKAEWMGSTNRRTSPNVRLGEQVKLYTNSSTGEYWWESSGRDDDLRRLETITWTWNASGVGTDEDIEITPNNHYSFTMDTRNQLITFTTSKDNGEPFLYTFQLNTCDGQFTFKDDVENIIQVDSAATKITLHNKDNSWFTLDKEFIHMYAPLDITALADRDIKLECKRDFFLTVGRDSTVKIERDSTTTVGRNESSRTEGNQELYVGGDVKDTVDGNCKEELGKDLTRLTKGNESRVIKGNATLLIEGSSGSTVLGGSTSSIEGDTTSTIKGDHEEVVDGKKNTTVKGGMTTKISGDYDVTTPKFTLQGDFEVTGDTLIKGDTHVEGDHEIDGSALTHGDTHVDGECTGCGD